jgi:hypothetical protein
MRSSRERLARSRLACDCVRSGIAWAVTSCRGFVSRRAAGPDSRRRGVTSCRGFVSRQSAGPDSRCQALTSCRGFVSRQSAGPDSRRRGVTSCRGFVSPRLIVVHSVETWHLGILVERQRMVAAARRRSAELTIEATSPVDLRIVLTGWGRFQAALLQPRPHAHSSNL